MARFDILFTLDYEIHGNGEGRPRALMTRPTGRLLDLFQDAGARLTIMADTAELLRYREVADRSGRDYFGIGDIEEQLRTAVARGHDVQLHVHPSYLKAEFVGRKWEQYYKEYSCADLPRERITEIISGGKTYLERLLRPGDPDYACLAFRAANWSMCPSHHIVPALIENGIRYDSSVFKYGSRKGTVTFDYSQAPSNIVPWRPSAEDICGISQDSPLIEIPIYCERRHVWAFASLGRLRRVLTSRQYPVKLSGMPSRRRIVGRLRDLGRLVLSRHAWKLDFNQCSAGQIVRTFERIACNNPGAKDLPVVLIGHSKLADTRNGKELAQVLAYLNSKPEVFRFSTFRQLSGAWSHGREPTAPERLASCGVET